jgi:hypothetical protein
VRTDYDFNYQPFALKVRVRKAVVTPAIYLWWLNKTVVLMDGSYHLKCQGNCEVALNEIVTIHYLYACGVNMNIWVTSIIIPSLDTSSFDL